MKKYMILLFLIVSACLLTNCSKEDEKSYYSALGTISVTEDSTIITTDDDQRLLVENKNSFGTEIKNNDRVVANFTMVNQTLPTGIDYIINIYYIEKVLFKPVIELTPEIADSIGNDALNVTSMWIGKDYLNLNFSFLGGNKNHLINLIRYPGEIPLDTIKLEIRHNNNDDNGTYTLNGFVSFDLRSLRNVDADSVVVCIKAKEYQSITYEQCLSYKY